MLFNPVLSVQGYTVSCFLFIKKIYKLNLILLSEFLLYNLLGQTITLALDFVIILLTDMRLKNGLDWEHLPVKAVTI